MGGIASEDRSHLCEVLPLLAGRSEVRAPTKLKFKVHPTRNEAAGDARSDGGGRQAMIGYHKQTPSKLPRETSRNSANSPRPAEAVHSSTASSTPSRLSAMGGRAGPVGPAPNTRSAATSSGSASASRSQASGASEGRGPLARITFQIADDATASRWMGGSGRNMTGAGFSISGKAEQMASGSQRRYDSRASAFRSAGEHGDEFIGSDGRVTTDMMGEASLGEAGDSRMSGVPGITASGRDMSSGDVDYNGAVTAGRSSRRNKPLFLKSCFKGGGLVMARYEQSGSSSHPTSDRVGQVFGGAEELSSRDSQVSFQGGRPGPGSGSGSGSGGAGSREPGGGSRSTHSSGSGSMMERKFHASGPGGLSAP